MSERELWQAWSARMAEARAWKRRALAFEAEGAVADAWRCYGWHKVALDAAHRYARRAWQARRAEARAA